MLKVEIAHVDKVWSQMPTEELKSDYVSRNYLAVAKISKKFNKKACPLPYALLNDVVRGSTAFLENQAKLGDLYDRSYPELGASLLPRKVKSIAHRGLSGVFLDNTLEAFNAAMRIRCDMIELDLHLCKDAVVVYHDYFLPNEQQVCLLVFSSLIFVRIYHLNLYQYSISLVVLFNRSAHSVTNF
jgi:hypothetical protein